MVRLDFRTLKVPINSFASWEIVRTFLSTVDIFEKNLSGIPSESNSLDPDQAQGSVRPDLVPNCLQKLSADGTWRQRVKQTFL